MIAAVAQYGPWFLSLLTLAMYVSVGRGDRLAWLGFLVCQGCWLVWIAASGNWGLLPLTVGLIAVSAYNHCWPARRVDTSADDGLEMGWVVTDAAGLRFRRWGDAGPEWTADADKALHFSRRWPDAEEFCAEDEDAWCIVRHAYRPALAEREVRRTAGVRVL